MICMMDTNTDLYTVGREIGMVCEQLFTPLTRRAPQFPDDEFAIDNGAFGKHGFQLNKFMNCLRRHITRANKCRWVAVPDMVGSAQRTAELFEYWQPQLKFWPLAYVAQDGQDIVPIPWKHIACVFIGGTDTFKESIHAVHIIKTAQMMEKWVHVGRVNTPARLEFFEKLGVDSVDGTGIAQYTHMRTAIKDRNAPNRLFSQSEMTAEI